MKKFILKLIPDAILLLYVKYFQSKKRHQFVGNSAYETFTHIYKANHWKSRESISGTGSDLEQTAIIIKEIDQLIVRLGIKSLLDIPCGDFNWMQKVDLSHVKYLGADIVEELILENNKKYGKKDKIDFSQINLISDHLPKSDLLINRDCLVHLSFNDITDSIRNIKRSGCKYLLTTTFPRHKINYDIITGHWRPLNLEKAPFSFPKPLLVISENYPGNKVGSSFADKSLALWSIADIKIT